MSNHSCRSPVSVRSLSILLFVIALALPAEAAPRRRIVFPKEKALRIVSVEAIDDGALGSESGTFGIDVRQGVCDADGGSPEAEPFFDSLLGISVLNTTGAFVRFTKFSYSVQNADGLGSKHNSTPIALVGGGYIESADDPSKIFALFLKAQSGGKLFNRAVQPIPADLGIRNVTVRLIGTTAARQKVRIRARIALSFGDIDRCDEAG